MNILIIDDNISILYSLKETLVEHGHKVVACTSAIDASFYVEDGNSIDCIVVDLSMPVYGFDEEQVRRSCNGVLTGWVWLVNYILKKERDIKCIIFSDYTDVLERYLDENPEEKVLYKKVTVFAKSDIDSTKLLLKEINRTVVSKRKSGITRRSVFLSFCSRDSDITDIVEQRLTSYFGNAISVSRWERDVKYRCSFRKFIDTLKDHDFIISIISDQYLKSRACMYEIGKIIDEPSFQNKLLFIVLSDEDKQYYKTSKSESIEAKVYDLSSHFGYFEYWKNEYESLSTHADKLGIFVVSSEHKAHVHQTKKILDDIQKFLSYIYDARGIPFAELIRTDFQVIKDTINNYY